MFYSTYRHHYKSKKSRLGDCRLKFDLETLKLSIDPGKIVKTLVDLTHIAMLGFMGEREAALKRCEASYTGLPDVRLDGDQDVR
jgi:hypothetical protein